MNNQTGISAKSTTNYAEELKKSYDAESSAETQLTYYFESRESNPLKNVITTEMRQEETTAYHKHDFYEINYVVEGRLHENISGRYFSLSEGEMLIMSPGVYHACIPEANTRSLNILFEKNWLLSTAQSFKKYDPNNYLSSLVENTIYTIISSDEHRQKTNEHVLKLHEMLSRLIHHVDLYENLASENYAVELLLFLTKIPRQEFNFETAKRVQKALYTPDDIVRYINDNFSKISLPDTAQRFGYSQCQLHRIIKKHTGYTFSELIVNMRMQRARHYLLNTHLPIKSISSLLGLDSPEHFTRMFKKNRGMTPKEYRDEFMRLSLQNQK